MYHVNVDKLNGKIAERGTTKEAVANELGVARTTFYRRLKHGKLLIGDIHKMCDFLNLSDADAVDIFLAK